MKKYIIKYGIIASVILLVVGGIGIAFHDKLGLGMAEVLGFASMFLAFSVIFIAVRSYRNEELGGKISFGKAFLMGLIISLIVTAVYVVGWLMYYNPESSNFMQSYTAQIVGEMREAGQSQENIDLYIQKMFQQTKMYNSSSLYRAGLTAMEILPVGIFFSLISAGFLFKRKRSSK